MPGTDGTAGARHRQSSSRARAWIDAGETGIENPPLHLEKEAGLFVSDGAFFGWPGWFRFNFACPRAHMLEGLEKLAKAFT